MHFHHFGIPLRWPIILLSLLVALLIVSALACAIGPTSIPVYDSVRILLNHLPGINIPLDWDESSEMILWHIRLPRVYMGALVGAALTLAGIAFQALLRNSLAEPYILGISSGGSLGALLAIALGFGAVKGIPTLPLFAFIGSLLTMFMVYQVARVDGRVPTHTLLLAGVVVNLFFSAILLYLISIVGLTEARSFQFWSMGDLGAASPAMMFTVSLLVAASGLILLLHARNFNLMVLGEESATYLGVHVERMKILTFVLASLMTGAVVSACGMIGFVGLIIPHISRMLWGTDHRLLIPAGVLTGAIFLIAADTLARVIVAPIGVITAMCGGPFFIYLLRTQRKAFFG